MVYNAIDCIEKYDYILKNKKIGFLTSISAVDKNLNSSIEILHNRYGLTALFSPEHGVRGDMAAGAMVDTYVDPETNVPVHSLYRKDSKRFTEEMLKDIDVLVYEIQDVGTRYYTFISSLLYALEDCAKYGKELVVLDRINPLGGTVCEGNILNMEFSSFVGIYPVPMRYGLTAGEFATMVNEQQNINCKLTVAKCEGWKREMLFPETQLLWMMPSLGIPRFDTALLYPGTCLFEGTNISEGRGTSCPFEIIGAPFINGRELARQMNALKLDGVLFTAAYFAPTTSKHQGEKCQGVHVHITDYKKFKAVKTGLTLLYKIHEMYSDDFEFLAPLSQGRRAFIELLVGGDLLTKGQMPKLESVLADFEQQSKEFEIEKQKYHLYK